MMGELQCRTSGRLTRQLTFVCTEIKKTKKQKTMLIIGYLNIPDHQTLKGACRCLANPCLHIKAALIKFPPRAVV